MDRGVTVVSNRIERRQLRPGDHIYAWFSKSVIPYSHHGIYESDEKVIHFNSSGVAICCLDRFLRGQELRLFAYAVPPWFYTASNHHAHPQACCTTEAEDPPETVLRRANDLLLYGFGHYNLIINNCMSFAFYCKTGRCYDDLVKRTVATTSKATTCLCILCMPSGDGPDLDGPNGSPETARVVPPSPRRRSPELPRVRLAEWPGGVQHPVPDFGEPAAVGATAATILGVIWFVFRSFIPI